MNDRGYMEVDAKRTVAEKLALFRSLFSGRSDVYGTYDPVSGKSRQVKAPVTDRVLHDHLAGKQPYGVYLLVEDRTQAIVVDFDEDDPTPGMDFLKAAEHYGLHAYIERSKSKGHHVWMWFTLPGVFAAKARRVVLHILAELGFEGVEIFPKQDRLPDGQYGNFINCPLNGRLVQVERTVFLDPTNGLKPHSNQWDFLEGVQRVAEKTLDEIIEVNGLERSPPGMPVSARQGEEQTLRSFGLPPCARRMLTEGVTENQRVACFRLAVGLRKAGVPLDAALAALNIWALKNQPENGKGIISRQEVMAQAASAYSKPYRSCGCDDPAVAPYCGTGCPLLRRKRRQSSVGEPRDPERQSMTKGMVPSNNTQENIHEDRSR